MKFIITMIAVSLFFVNCVQYSPTGGAHLSRIEGAHLSGKWQKEKSIPETLYFCESRHRLGAIVLSHKKKIFLVKKTEDGYIGTWYDVKKHNHIGFYEIKTDKELDFDKIPSITVLAMFGTGEK